LLRPATGLGFRWLTGLCGHWLVRVAPLVALAYVVGIFASPAGFWPAAALGSLLGVVYLYWMRPLYPELPVGPRLRVWLARFRLEPPPVADGATQAEPGFSGATDLAGAAPSRPALLGTASEAASCLDRESL
jgi:hypothetical protein